MTNRITALVGPPGVGRTTLARQVAREFDYFYIGYSSELEGTLGAHVQELWKYPTTFGVGNITGACGALLHVVGHIDVIQTQIAPVYESGFSIILDGFFWAVEILAKLLGVPPLLVSAMARVEYEAWQEAGIFPDQIVLIDSPKPYIEVDSLPDWHKLREGYFIHLNDVMYYPEYQGVVLQQVNNEDLSQAWEALAELVHIREETMKVRGVGA